MDKDNKKKDDIVEWRYPDCGQMVVTLCISFAATAMVVVGICILSDHIAGTEHINTTITTRSSYIPFGPCEDQKIFEFRNIDVKQKPFSDDALRLFRYFGVVYKHEITGIDMFSYARFWEIELYSSMCKMREKRWGWFDKIKQLDQRTDHVYSQFDISVDSQSDTITFVSKNDDRTIVPDVIPHGKIEGLE